MTSGIGSSSKINPVADTQVFPDTKTSKCQKITAIMILILGLLLITVAIALLLMFSITTPHIIASSCMVIGALALAILSICILSRRCIFRTASLVDVEKIKRLDTELNTLKARLESSETQLKTAQDETASLKEELKIANSTEEAQLLQQRITILQKELADTLNDKKALQSRIPQLEQKIASLHEQLLQITNQSTALIGQDIASLQQELTVANEAKAFLQQKLTKTQIQLQGAIEMTQSLSSKIERLTLEASINGPTTKKLEPSANTKTWFQQKTGILQTLITTNPLLVTKNESPLPSKESSLYSK